MGYGSQRFQGQSCTARAGHASRVCVCVSSALHGPCRQHVGGSARVDLLRELVNLAQLVRAFHLSYIHLLRIERHPHMHTRKTALGRRHQSRAFECDWERASGEPTSTNQRRFNTISVTVSGVHTRPYLSADFDGTLSVEGHLVVVVGGGVLAIGRAEGATGDKEHLAYFQDGVVRVDGVLWIGACTGREGKATVMTSLLASIQV